MHDWYTRVVRMTPAAIGDFVQYVFQYQIWYLKNFREETIQQVISFT